MSTEQFIAIILMIAICNILVISAVWYNRYKINRLTDDVNDVMQIVSDIEHTLTESKYPMDCSTCRRKEFDRHCLGCDHYPDKGNKWEAPV